MGCDNCPKYVSPHKEDSEDYRKVREICNERVASSISENGVVDNTELTDIYNCRYEKLGLKEDN